MALVLDTPSKRIVLSSMAALLALTCALPVTAQTTKFRGDSLTVEQIDGAIDRAVNALYNNPRLQPRYEPLPEYIFYASKYSISQEIRNMMGNHALVAWSLIACGESYQNPKLYRRINWVLSGDQSLTYDRSMRLQMLAGLPRERWKPWVHRDAVWLTGAITNQGNFDEDWLGKPKTGYGDNANGQYGVLGLWGCERNGYPIKAEAWRAVDKYWREAQEQTKDEAPAGWAVYSSKHKPSDATNVTFNRRISGPMTAGGVATLCLTERFLYGPKMITPGEQHVSPELRKGIRWLDQNFSMNDKAEDTDRYYYFWTMQRVGHATGYKSYRGVDLFRDITAVMLNEQQADGTWLSEKGQLLSTGFALLYLSKAYDPIAVSKLRFQTKDASGYNAAGPWNNRPHDIWNFVDYISDQYEFATTWQIAELELPAYSLIESPILYLATDGRFEFSEKEVKNLRDYLNAGGLLLFNPDKVTPETTQSINKLAEQLYPDRKWDRIKPEHPFYTVHQSIKTPMPLQVIDNGIRPLIVQLQRDIGKGLQANEVTTSDSFRIMSNIYLYVTGKNYRRMRLVNNYEPRVNTEPRRRVAAARIKHNGVFDPEPGSMTQLQNLVANHKDIDLQVNVVDAKALSKENIAFLTTMGDGTLTADDAAAIRKWVEAGGLLVLDAAGGSQEAAKNSEAMVNAIFSDLPRAPLSFDHPVISGERMMGGENCRWVRYRNFALATMGPVNRPKLQAIEVNNRVGVIYSTEDLTCGLAGLDHWGIFGYTPEYARKLTTNAVLVSAQIR